MDCVLAFILLILVYCSCTVIDTSNTSISSISISKKLFELNSVHPSYEKKTSLLELEKNVSTNTGTSAAKARYKRQQSSGAGKFTEAAQMPQLKLLRLFLTMFKNLWAKSYTGGSNPFHPYVPKPIVQLFKQRIVNFFFPEIGEEAMKKN